MHGKEAAAMGRPTRCGSSDNKGMRAYESDFAGWAEDTARAIQAGDFEHVDRAALAEEIADLSRSQRRELRNRLRLLLIHLLKKQYQPELQTRSWENTIREQLSGIQEELHDSPSLKSVLPELFAGAYDLARLGASTETGLPLEEFPEAYPWTLEQVIAP